MITKLKVLFQDNFFDVLVKEGDQVYAKFEVQKIEYHISEKQ